MGAPRGGGSAPRATRGFVSAKTKGPARVAYFSDAPWAGGAERYLHLLASNLPRDEFSPCLVVDDAGRLETLCSWMRDSGVPVHEAAISFPPGARSAARFVRTLRGLDVSILHCNMPGPWGSLYGFAAPLAKLAGARGVVSTEHLPMIPPFAKGALLKRIGGAFIDRVLTVSEDNARWLRERHRVPARKIRVVRIGIPDPEAANGASVRSALGFGGGDFVCLMAGSLEERKGHRFAFEALSRLPARVKLVVAGAGESGETLRERAAALGIAERIRFLGFRGDIFALLGACDVLLVPSLLEATPYVIVEAMALARPVVASRIFGIPELVADGRTGMLVEPGSVDALVRAIGELESDSELAARLGEAGRGSFEREFRVERCVAETVSIYREILKRR